MCGLTKPKPLSAYTIDDLLYHLKRQFPDAVGTTNNCAEEKCNGRVVGTGFCKECLIVEFDRRGYHAMCFSFLHYLEKRQHYGGEVWRVEQKIREAAK